MTPRRLSALLAPTAAAATALACLIAAPASAASDRGLFGSQDPTYDGVYRQGLAIAGLAAGDTRVPRSSVRWLLRQQCPNGAFTAYRADPATRCAAPDPTTYSGQDTNATAMAAMALAALGKDAPAARAWSYLRRQQNTDGGVPWFRGGTSDTNSTGLFLAAARSFDLTRPERKQVKRATRFVAATQLGCSAAPGVRGMLQFQAGTGTADALGSAQSAVGLVTTLPAARNRIAGAPLDCPGTGPAKDPEPALLHALARTLDRNGGLLPSSFGSGPDVTASANAAIALSAARYRPGTVSRTVKALKRAAATYTVTDGSTNAGSTATLLLTAAATRTNPARFGGVDLSRALLRSRR